MTYDNVHGRDQDGYWSGKHRGGQLRSTVVRVVRLSVDFVDRDTSSFVNLTSDYSQAVWIIKLLQTVIREYCAMFYECYRVVR